ncbi:MAG: hypothetical protein AAB691_01290 [Patescibacteria group bacterium]
MIVNFADLDPKLFERILKDGVLRRAITRRSHPAFFYTYFHEYAKYKIAPFQLEMFRLTEDDTAKLTGITSFRGSAKSSIMTMSFPIWAILGRLKKKYVVIVSQTQTQARQHLKNIKEELERNELLRKDLGPFEEQDDEWHSYALVIPRHKAKIIAVSIDQGVRGLRHGANRPDLILCDDIEDLSSVKTREGRNKTFDWITGELLPSGDLNTKVVIVGNLLHEDSALMRLERMIRDGKLDGVFRKFPLLDGENRIAWPHKFPNLEAVDNLRRAIGNEIAFQREFLLRIVPDTDQIVHPEWIHYYDTIPFGRHQLLYTITGIDLAISQKESADYTAMVSAKVYSHENKLYIYILKNPVNERLNFSQTLDRAEMLSRSLGSGYPTHLIVEDVAYQRAAIEQLQDRGLYVMPFRAEGDKRSRLMLTTPMLEAGRVLFPRRGAEQLIQQILGFGVENHDDLMDSFTMLVLRTLKDKQGSLDTIVLG